MPARQRRSLRLAHYDYTQAGAYFITLCAFQRELSFGEIVSGEMRLSKAGQIAAAEWERSAIVRPNVALDVFVVMPNHLHGIIVLMDTPVGATRRSTVDVPSTVGAHSRAPLHRPPRSLGSFVAGFKSAVTKRINALRGTPGRPVWQRNYYEHVIRDEHDLARIREYIAGNPARWAEDEDNPARRAA